MYAEVVAALAAVKSLTDIAKIVNDTSTSAQILDKTIELQGTILSLQEEMSALHSNKDTLIQEKKLLEQQLAQFEKWESTATCYAFTQISNGVFAYAKKSDCGQAEGPHWICANCYENRHRSILHLQPRKRGPGFDNNDYHKCFHCGNEFMSNLTPGSLGGA